MSTDAHRWLDAALVERKLEPVESAVEALCQSIRAESSSRQIALLKACVERLPVLRQRARDDPNAFLLGSVLYGVACTLYGDRLPYQERDICDLLRTSRHTCGHGQDVVPPVDAAFDHALRFGVSADLMEAMRAYAGGLTGTSSSTAKHLKRRAALFYLLDPEVRDGEQRCWSHRLRAGLARVPPEERVRWHELILRMSLHDNPRMPKTWQRAVDRFTARVQIDAALTRLEEWWPEDRPGACPLQSAGSQFLKHAVWMLELFRDRVPEAEARCDRLVLRLAALDWQPRERAKKVAVVAAAYLARRPVEVSWIPLQRLAAWSISVKRGENEPNRIADIAAAFARAHGLAGPPLAVATGETPRPEAEGTGWFGRFVTAARRLIS